MTKLPNNTHIKTNPYVINSLELEPEEQITEGLVLIARGLERIGSKEKRNQPRFAACHASYVAEVMAKIAVEFEEDALLKEQVERSNNGNTTGIKKGHCCDY